MLQVRDILVPTDNSVCARAAMQHARRLARSSGAVLHLLHVDELRETELQVDGLQGNALEVAGLYVDEGSAAGQNPVRSARAPDEPAVTVRRVFRRAGAAAPVIIAYVRQHNIGMVVMGTHGLQSISRFLNGSPQGWLIGDTTDRVLRSAACPVLTVGPRRQTSPDRINRILVSLDADADTPEVARQAVLLAQAYEAEVVVLHGAASTAAALDQLKHPFNQFAGTGTKVDYHERQGPPHKAVIQFAEQHEAELIVLATRSSLQPAGGIGSSNIAHVVRASPYPVLTLQAYRHHAASA